MLDYKLLAALAAVIEQGGFERAAQSLSLSQSAVSQRIKLLEARLGRPVLERSAPPVPTEVGRHLLNHVQQVRLLERDVRAQVPALADGSGRERLRIALNADSLATWWAPVVGSFVAEQQLLIEHLIEDQEVGLKRMRAGEVAACVCATERAVSGARAERLGSMRYLAVASPAYIQRYFPVGVNEAALLSAPSVVFSRDDRLQHRYLAQLGVVGGFSYHLCPSSEGYDQLVRAGFGWGMVPALQAEALLQQGQLQELVPGQGLDVALYWHHWRNGGELLAQLTAHVCRQARQWLAPEG